MQYTEEQIRDFIKKADSKSEACRLAGFHPNGTGMRKINHWVQTYNLDISHFDGGASRKRKYKTITKICPVCGNKFNTQAEHQKEKTVCSHACSNTYFRTGKNNGSYKTGSYRSVVTVDGKTIYAGSDYRRICFEYWPHKCALCDWDLTLDVHHMDGNHENNEKENLIPLCPNHHRLLSIQEHKEEIQKKLLAIAKDHWKKDKT